MCIAPDAPQRQRLLAIPPEIDPKLIALAKAGLSNRDMAHRLFVSVRTVENHMHRLLKKLGYANRRQLRDEWNPDL